jgi:hypothetical protein
VVFGRMVVGNVSLSCVFAQAFLYTFALTRIRQCLDSLRLAQRRIALARESNQRRIGCLRQNAGRALGGFPTWHGLCVYREPTKLDWFPPGSVSWSLNKHTLTFGKHRVFQRTLLFV